MTKDCYQSPLKQRYASQSMLNLFSPQFKHRTWRRLWLELARAQKTLGLDISQEQLDQMEGALDCIDFEAVKEYEAKVRHDVMAHICHFSDLCPKAKPIIHLGATSCYVTDNTELIQMRHALGLLTGKILVCIQNLSRFALTHANLCCLGFTHYQPAQLTTVGKRACMWIQDLLFDLEDLTEARAKLAFLGAKGATGTQSSFLHLLGGDAERVKQLDQHIQRAFGFEKLLPISGQTYTRKQDIRVTNALAGLACSAHKFANDLRLLANLREVEEPFEEKQVGSSAMPYKRNPMRSERISGLSRFLISLSDNPKYTAATQWFERTLDDSSNRRLVISEAFLTADAILELLANVSSNLVVYPLSIAKRVKEELPFMATENILMEAVQRGGDRNALHEKLRLHSIDACRQIKEKGLPNDLLQRIASDPEFKLSQGDLVRIVAPEKFTGLASEQCKQFLKSDVAVALKGFSQDSVPMGTLSV